MPLESHQKCCRRPREHKQFYLALFNLEEENTDLKMVNIEKMKKNTRNKRCAMDQDYGLAKHMVEALYDGDVQSKNIKIMMCNFDDDKKLKEKDVKLVLLA